MCRAVDLWHQPTNSPHFMFMASVQSSFLGINFCEMTWLFIGLWRLSNCVWAHTEPGSSCCCVCCWRLPFSPYLFKARTWCMLLVLVTPEYQDAAYVGHTLTHILQLQIWSGFCYCTGSAGCADRAVIFKTHTQQTFLVDKCRLSGPVWTTREFLQHWTDSAAHIVTSVLTQGRL